MHIFSMVILLLGVLVLEDVVSTADALKFVFEARILVWMILLSQLVVRDLNFLFIISRFHTQKIINIVLLIVCDIASTSSKATLLKIHLKNLWCLSSTILHNLL